MNKDEIKAALVNRIVEVTFTKVNGDTRTMQCTLIEDYIPTKQRQDSYDIVKNPDVQPVWDIQSEGWRAFRWENVTNARVLGQ